MKWFCTILSVLLVATSAAADEDALSGRPRVQILRVSEPPVLDGQLDDQAWKGAAKISQFTQQNPREGQPASQPTEVWIAYDSHNIYFAIYAHYTDAALMRANRSRRDQTRRDDRVAIYFDTFLDQQHAYRFSVNGYAVQGDAILNASGGRGGGGGGGGGGGFGRGEDDSWDALFQTAGHPVADGWIVEMAIPFKSLRYPTRTDGEDHRWGLQIARNVESLDEDDYWSPVSRSVQGFLTQMGVLYGMTDLSTSRNFEILPTATAARFGTRDSDTGVYTQNKLSPDFGVNFKYGITSNLTADFTYNPDFSQIESDRPQIQVNQRYPLFYAEQRPFFLEGQEIFNTDINLVHTRTIVDPRYGVKLTGKVRNTALGLLVANDEAPGHVDDVADPAFGQKAQFVIARLRQDLYTESFVGALVTDREFENTFSRTAGVDGRFRLGQTYRLAFMVAANDYLNPDNEDAGEARHRGYAVEASFNRSGRHLEYSVRHNNYSPDFFTDTGFIRRNDIQQTSLNTSYTFRPEGAVNNWGPRAQFERNYDHRGVLQDEQIELGLNARFARNVGVRAQASRELERYEEIDFRKNRYSLNGDANFSSRVSFGGGWDWGDGIRYVDDPFLGRSSGGHFSVTARPTSRLEANLSINLSRFRDLRDVEQKDEFSVEIYRTRVTYQFTDRLQLRNILELDTYDRKFGVNLLLSYQINSGTVFFVGYDDRQQAAVNINDEVFDTTRVIPTSRSFFMKFSYLFRY
jgi:hypothetical protein